VGQLFIADIPKIEQIQNICSIKLKQVSLTIPVEFVIGSDLTLQNMSHPLSSPTAQSCLHEGTSGHRYFWRWSAHLLDFKFSPLNLLLEGPGFPSATDELSTQLTCF